MTESEKQAVGMFPQHERPAPRYDRMHQGPEIKCLHGEAGLILQPRVYREHGIHVARAAEHDRLRLEPKRAGIFLCLGKLRIARKREILSEALESAFQPLTQKRSQK